MSEGRDRRRRRGAARARREQRRERASRRSLPPGARLAPEEELIVSAGDGAEEVVTNKGRGRTLVIACGALAREILLLKKQLGLEELDLHCLPAAWHNTPQYIPEGVKARIAQARREGYERVFVAYGDCGTGGKLDEVLEEAGVERLPGAHCYAFFSGVEAFLERLEDDARSYFLTDYLARHFDSLVWRGMMLDEHPELLRDYFGNYEKLVYLAQTDDPALDEKAREAARRLGLTYERRLVGMGDLEAKMRKLAAKA